MCDQRTFFACGLAATILLGSVTRGFPADKSGVKPTAISLPSGAGSIEGLGESFEPQLNTGSASYGIAISVPPGRAGLQPRLRLAYNSNLGNSFVGLGWSLDLLAIKRQTDKGFPNYNQQDVFIFAGEELVPLSDGSWRCENESQFQRFRQIDSDGDGRVDGWEMTERSGIRHYFGRYRGADARWSVVEHPQPPATAGALAFDRTYCWALDSTIDLHSNRIDYAYFHGDGILYPSRITYSHLAATSGTNYHEVLFDYEDRPDVFNDYRPTFAVRTDKRLKRIEVRSFYEGISHLVRAFELSYEYRSSDGIQPAQEAMDLGISLLKRVVQFDRSGGTNNYLPPLLFEYSALNTNAARLQWLTQLPDIDLGDGDGNTQIADVDGDGLPDIFRTEANLTREQRACLNQGEVNGQLRFANAVTMVPASFFNLADSETTLTDIDGNGLVDVVQLSQADIVTGKKQLMVFGDRSRLDRRDQRPPGFAAFSDDALEGVPRDVSFNNPAMRQMDVDFDKVSDFVTTSFALGRFGQFHYYLRDRSGAWQHLGPVDFPADMPPFTFDENGAPNPHVHLADMNGDRLQDLVYLETNGSFATTLRVIYWPYAGHGQWGTRQVMTASDGDNLQIDNLDLRDVLVQDFTGDGLADLAYLTSDGGGSSTLFLRVNIAGQRWSAPIVRGGLPRFQPRDSSRPTTFRQADLNGNGSVDLIWRNRVIGDDSLAWLELMPQGKPNLLTRIDNGLGKITEITYGSSTEDFIRAREAGYPWQTRCPFPVQVVRRIRTTGGQDLDGLDDTGRQDANGRAFTTDQYVSEFHYRDAFYDAFEREFRGFAFAERVDYGDDFLIDTNLTTMVPSSGWDRTKTPTGQVSGPTLVTRFRYLTGAADGIDNDEYPPGWTGPSLIDEISPQGGHEEEILKGRQVWEEKVDPWVLHDSTHGGDFDRGCFLAMTSTNSAERLRMTPNDFVYTRVRQAWTVRRLYRPLGPITNLVPDADGFFREMLLDRSSPPGRFESSSPKIFVIGGEGGSGRSVSFAFPSSVTNEVIEANALLQSALGYSSRAPVLTASTSDFDDYGNETVERNFGVVNDAAFDDERFTFTDFALQGEALGHWIIDKPSRIRVTDENGVFVSETRNYYDGQPLQGLGLHAIGARALLHRIEQIITGDSSLPDLSAQSSRPGDPRLPPGSVIQKVRSAYDVYGNPLLTFDPLGSALDLSVGHRREFAYDPTFQTYPIRETISVGGGNSNLVMSASYDPGFGVMTDAIDFNGNETRFDYDSFSRLIAIIKPYDTPAFPTAVLEYLPADPTRFRIYHYDHAGNLTLETSGIIKAANRVITRLREQAGQSGAFVSVSYSDGLGRKLAEVSESDAAGRWIVKSAQSFNRRLNIQAQWLPYEIASGSGDSNPPQFGQIWPSSKPPAIDFFGHTSVKIDKLYDPLGREIAAINPPETAGDIGNEKARTRSFTHILPLETQLFDEEDANPASAYYNTPHIQLKDGLDRLISVIEVTRLTDDGYPLPPDGKGARSADNTNHWLTRYEYDLNDNLTHIIDSQGNQKWFRYDGLKRKLFMNDPDRGTMTYTYDDASNLRETVDAKAQRISYTYDGVNRLLTEHYRPTNQPPDVTYHYDIPAGAIALGDGMTATPQNTLGMLAYVQDLSGEEHTSYDARGRVSFVVKRIPDPLNGSLVSYRTGFAYDSLDRVNALTYPDNDFVKYGYNSRNLLNQIAGGPSGFVISNILYQPSAQLREIDYGNSIRTTYGYDPRLRLSSLITAPATNPASPLISFSYDFDGVSNIKDILDNRPASVVAAGDPRRNTQLFAYDDLYRITQAQYSFNTPGNALRNDGQINYRHDRIGNMLAQNSSLSDTDPLTGLPVANLGRMDSGGSAGRYGRIGRQPNDPPGPHALTSITNRQLAIANRQYPYDANGNMLIIDGLTNTWDFKDRLVAVENSQMRAVYTYDYTDRRITKQVFTKKNAVAPASPTLTTLYIDKYFEVRDHDAPVKYVWNGNTRVARVTGSLNSSQRVQRLRLWPGYNLISVVVGGASVPTSPQISAAYLWNLGTQDWQSVATATTLAAGSVLWVQAATNGVLTFTGNYSDPTVSPVAIGPNFLPVPGLETLSLTNSNTQLATNEWRYDAQNQLWQIALAVPLTNFNSLPTTFAPGEVLFVRADAAMQLTPTDPTLRVRYYHEDHLGSSSVLSDATGALVNETANYAFGFTRAEFNPRKIHEHYKFTQKEKDDETEMSFVESRYLWNTVGLFTQPDTLLLTGPYIDGLTNPQKLNLYRYVGNNPEKYIDPRGLEGEEANLIVSQKGPSQNSNQRQSEPVITIDVMLSKDRWAAGTLRVSVDGKPIAEYKALGRGSAGQGDTQFRNKGNTPTGTYKASIEETKDRNQDSYGPNGAFRLSPEEGNAKIAEQAFGRKGLLIHAGSLVDDWRGEGQLHATHGCLRLSNEDIQSLRTVIETFKSQTEQKPSITVNVMEH